ncbi:DUF6585 family protein [Actinomadura sp. LOL_016]|uniref:DUF6585 family protein n=1 Tax=unclassified Actinomadura TaxID=2626254 RepID=UPI003A80BBC9
MISLPLLLVGTIWLTLAYLITAAMYVWFTWSKIRHAGRGRGAQLDIFARGVRVTGPGDQVFVFRWETVTVLRSVVHSHKNGTVRSTYVYVLMGQDRRALVIGDNAAAPPTGALDAVETVRGPAFENPKMWGDTIQNRVADVQIPRVARMVEDGGSVTFGPVQVTPHELRTKEGDAVPWSRIDRFRVVNGWLWVMGRDRKRPLLREAAGVIPNFPVFYALAETLRRKAH